MTDVRPGGNQFPTTAWTMVRSAGQGAATTSREAFATIVQNYWQPVYLYVRRRGYDVEEARDLTQAFFTRLLEKGSLAAADQTRGRFRAFVLTSVKNFLLNYHDRQSAQKRRGSAEVSLDFDSAEASYQVGAASGASPEQLFERRWARALLERAVNRLRAELGEERFEHLKGFLTGDAERGDYAQTAAKLGLTESAMKQTVHRLRRRYKEAVHAEIAYTVEDPADVEEEIRHLLRLI